MAGSQLFCRGWIIVLMLRYANFHLRTAILDFRLPSWLHSIDPISSVSLEADTYAFPVWRLSSWITQQSSEISNTATQSSDIYVVGYVSLQRSNELQIATLMFHGSPTQYSNKTYYSLILYYFELTGSAKCKMAAIKPEVINILVHR